MNTESSIYNLKCCFEDCKENAVVTVGKLNAPVCLKHAVVWQRSLNS